MTRINSEAAQRRVGEFRNKVWEAEFNHMERYLHIDDPICPYIFDCKIPAFHMANLICFFLSGSRAGSRPETSFDLPFDGDAEHWSLRRVPAAYLWPSLEGLQHDVAC